LALLQSATAADPYFTGLGYLPGGDWESGALGISANGQVVVGYSISEAADWDWEAFRWTLQGGMVGLGGLSGADWISSQASACNEDGSVIVGDALSGRSEPGQTYPAFEAFRWESGHMKGLGDLNGGGMSSYASGVSADGTVIVGTGRNAEGSEPVIWENRGRPKGLGYYPNGGSGGSAFSVTADGEHVVGWLIPAGGISEAFRWTEDTGPVPLGELPGGFYLSSALAISDDGSTTVGTSYADGGQEAVRWTADNTLISIGDFEGWQKRAAAFDVTADGSTIVGQGTGPDMFIGMGRRAFTWDEVHGMRYLHEVLEQEYGLDLGDWVLTSANAISADGRTIAGEGLNPAGDLEAWVAHLGSEDDPADFNGDGVVDWHDLVAFFIAYHNGDMSADFNGDGVLDADDVFAFLEAFYAAVSHPGLTSSPATPRPLSNQSNP
jgi:probable HAF family extracellular repeat protein